MERHELIKTLVDRRIIFTFISGSWRRGQIIEDALTPMLYDLAHDLHNANLCDVGVGIGGSTILLGHNARENHNTVYSIDVFAPYKEKGTMWEVGNLGEFHQNLAEFRVEAELRIGNSYEELAKFPDDFFDVIFIDACHDYDFVSKDIAVSKRKIKKGGVICGHDYTEEYPGVVQAVGEAFPDAETMPFVWKMRM